MKRSIAITIAGAALLVACIHSQALAQTPSLAGKWTLNRALSELPREIGFDAVFAGAAPADPSGHGRHEGDASAGTPAGFTGRRESEDDAKRLQRLTAEARNPSTQLLIAQTPDGITITNDQGDGRTFRPDGREQSLRIGDVPVATTARWEAGRLVVTYNVETGRQVRYTYSATADPPQLVVDVKFLDRGKGESAKRVYQPSAANDTSAPSAPAPAGRPTGSTAGLPLAARPSEAAAPTARAPQDPSRPATVPASPEAGQTFSQQPDAELKGITNLGVVVEDLSQQAVACGLNQGTIQSALSKALTDAGFVVRRNSDEDTYLYVNIGTTSMPGGGCVSRYDAFLYTHTVAKLSYNPLTPVLIEVSLLHKGGLAGGAPAAHADSVLQGLKQYVDQFVTRIRSASR